MTKWSTAQVRAAVAQEAEGGWVGIEPEDFDEWLAEVIREARYEGYSTCIEALPNILLGYDWMVGSDKNPYEKEQ